MLSAAQEFAKLFRLPAAEAVTYLQDRRRLTPTYSWQDLWHEEHAEQFTVSRLTRLDLLQAVQDGITKSVQGDMQRRDWIRDTKSLLKEAGWWGDVGVTDPATGDALTTRFDNPRLKLIFDTNTRMAYNAGYWERAWRNRATHPYVEYLTMGDSKVRPGHQRWNKLVLPIDHPFWATHWPPNGFRCRCRVRSMTAAEFERRMKAGDITAVAPEDVTIEWVNKRTGEVSQIPEGIQPGFDYNPGLKKTIRDGLLKVGLDKLDKLPAPIRRAAMSPVVREGVSEDFAAAVTGAYEALPINARRAIAASGYEVRVVGRLIDELPELQGKIPAGYPASLDYRHVDGLTLTTEKLILIAQQCVDSETNAWMASSLSRSQAVLRHEVGHVLDFIHEFSADPMLFSSWQREAAELLTWYGRFGSVADSEIDYFTLGKLNQGALEVVAELFANRHGGGAASVVAADAAFPDTMAALSKLLDEKGL